MRKTEKISQCFAVGIKIPENKVFIQEEVNLENYDENICKIQVFEEKKS